VQRCSSCRITTGPPCPCSSRTSSPVYEWGAGKKSASPSSIASPFAPRKAPCVAWRGGGVSPRIARAIAPARAPETRTMPMPPRPGGVAMAAIVSPPAVSGAPWPSLRPRACG
jgi:hypothetical protein